MVLGGTWTNIVWKTIATIWINFECSSVGEEHCSSQRVQIPGHEAEGGQGRDLHGADEGQASLGPEKESRRCKLEFDFLAFNFGLLVILGYELELEPYGKLAVRQFHLALA